MVEIQHPASNHPHRHSDKLARGQANKPAYIAEFGLRILKSAQIYIVTGYHLEDGRRSYSTKLKILAFRKTFNNSLQCVI